MVALCSLIFSIFSFDTYCEILKVPKCAIFNSDVIHTNKSRKSSPRMGIPKSKFYVLVKTCLPFFLFYFPFAQLLSKDDNVSHTCIWSEGQHNNVYIGDLYVACHVL